MLVIQIIMAVIAVIGALELIIGNRFGVGKEFQRGMRMFGELALCMLGIMTLSPVIAYLLNPVLSAIYNVIPIDSSVVFSSIFAMDMGGAKLAYETAQNPALAGYNGHVVGSMLGATICFTIPFALNTVKKEQHKGVMLGIMCGVCTVPIGCFIAGLVASVPFVALVINLIPLIVFSGIICFGLIKFPNASVKIFTGFGIFIKTLATVGLAIGIVEYLTGWDIPLTDPISSGAEVVFNVAVVETGAFPMMYILSKVLKKPLKKLGGVLSVNETASLGLLSTLATSVTTFGMMNDMDDKGVVVNSAFAVSASFTFADHLAYALAFSPVFLLPMIIGKLISGFCGFFLSLFIYKRVKKPDKPLEKKCNNE